MTINADLLRGPQRAYYAESEILELWAYLNEGFDHYECFNRSITLQENVSRLIGSHMTDAVQTELLKQTNTNAWFYDKETFSIGDVRIDTKI